jgi:hypothetical protein
MRVATVQKGYTCPCRQIVGEMAIVQRHPAEGTPAIVVITYTRKFSHAYRQVMSIVKQTTLYT